MLGTLSQPILAQTPIGEEGEIIDEVEVPILLPSPNPQAGLILATFCVDTSSSIVVFEVDRPAIEPSTSTGQGGGLGVATWRTVHAMPIDWAERIPGSPLLADLADLQCGSALVFGELQGPCGTMPAFGIAFDLVVDGVQKHVVVPLFAISTDELAAMEVLAAGPPEYWMLHPCNQNVAMPCWTMYRQRQWAAANAYGQCWFILPISWANFACFVPCLKWWGSPMVFAGCTAGCNFTASAAQFLSNLYACRMQLAYAEQQNREIYCACLEYQRTHCPISMEEPLSDIQCP
ncbi:MAG: hypothetical protein HRU70_06375 [Phycisphaeraceae bacterium]|nr:MAG: hypothetical protein HRU70_06375 [Phycisphaeraceae bacterium]